MTRARERFRAVLSGSTCVLAAHICDPLLVRSADRLEYQVYVLSGAVQCIAPGPGLEGRIGGQAARGGRCPDQLRAVNRTAECIQ